MKLKDFRQRCKIKFRTTLLHYLNKKYIFSEQTFENKETLETYVNDNFRGLVGKIYCTEENPKKLIHTSLQAENLDGFSKFELD